MEMTNVSVIVLLILFSTGFVRSIMDFEVNDLQMDSTLNELKVVERRALIVQCSSSLESLSFKWTKKEDPSFTVFGTNMSFHTILIQNSGNYVCEAFTVDRLVVERRNVTIDVLYPPVPILNSTIGPALVYDVGSFNVTCFVDSNPPSTYVWKEKSYGDIIARGPLYTEENGKIPLMTGPHCFAENTMIPTVGDPVFTSKYTRHLVMRERVAYIWSLYNGKYEIGETFRFYCKVHGTPMPKIWWTKLGDDRYTYTGGTMFIFNVTLDFSGWYTCNAENTVHPSGKAPIITTLSKSVYINITSKSTPGYPTNCLNIKPTPCLSSTDTPIMSSDQSSTVSLPPDFRATDLPEQTNATYIDRNLEPCLAFNNITFIALVIGWVCVLVLLFASFGMCIYHRKQLISIKQMNKVNQTIQHNDIARGLPSIPQPPASVRSTYYTYLELASQVNCNQYSESPTDSSGNDNGGYINPRSSVAQEVGDIAFDLPHHYSV